MNKCCYIAILFFIILLSLPQTVLSQADRIAVVSTFEGQIKIKHGGVWKTVTKRGNRMKNSAIYSDDTVLTMPGSSAVLIFSDNSRLEVKESTTMSIFEELISDETVQQGHVTNVSGVQKKDIVRDIKLKAGGIWANITPSKSVLTNFETASGIASVRGTTVTFDQQPDGSFAVQTVEGLMGFVTPGDDPVTFDIGGGDSVTVGMPVSGEVSLDVNSGTIEVSTQTGDVVNLNVGDGVEMGTTDTGDTSVTVTTTGEDGGVTIETDAGTVEMSADDAVAIGETDSGGTSLEVTATGEDGGVTIETDAGTVEMSADDAVAIGETDSGGTSLEVTATGEDGGVTVETDAGTVEMSVDDAVEIGETDSGGTSLEVTATGEDGGVTVETDAGTVEMSEADAVEVSDTAEDGSVEVTATSGEVTLATDAGDVTMDTGDAVAVTEGTDGIGLETTSGEVTLETGTGDVIMDTGDDVTVSVDAESGIAEIGVVDGDGVDVVDADTGETATVDVGSDVEVQAVVDEGSGVDSGTDGGADSGTDTGTDAGTDTGTDSGVDAGTDAGTDSGDGLTDGGEPVSVGEVSDGDIIAATIEDAAAPAALGDSVDSTVDSGGSLSADSGGGTVSDTGSIGGSSNKNALTAQSEEITSEPETVSDPDTDGDGFTDSQDAFPNNANSFWQDNFSSGNLDEWDTTTNASVGTSFGTNIGAKNGDSSDNFAIVHTGNGSLADTGKLIKEFDFQIAGTRNVTFDYNFVTTESAAAATTNFDDNPSSFTNYNGFDMSGVNIMSKTSYTNTYKNTTIDFVSGGYSVYGNNEGVIKRSSGNLFDFDGAHFTMFSWLNAKWGASAETITVEGYKAGVKTFDKSISLTTDFVWHDTNFTGVDEVRIESSASGKYWLMDDFVTTNNDYFKAELILSTGESIELAYEDVYTSTLTAVTDLPTSDLDNSSGSQTGWISVDWTGFAPAGLTKLIFGVYDAGDTLNDSAVLVDNVVDPLVDAVAAETTNVWMAFAQMIRDDIDPDNVSSLSTTGDSSDLQVDTDNINDADGVFSEIESISSTLNLTDIFGDIWTQQNNIFESEYAQHASVAMLLLTAKEIAESESGFSTNLNAIRNSLSLAKTFMDNHINDFGDVTDLGIRVMIDGILTKIDGVMDTDDLLAMNAIKGDISNVFCSVVHNLNHDGSDEEKCSLFVSCPHSGG